MKKYIVFIDFNPVNSVIPVYQLGIALLGGIAFDRGWEINVIEYDCLKRESGSKKYKSEMDRADCIAVSIRNVDNTEGYNSISYLQMMEKELYYIANNYREKTVVGGAGFSILPHTILEKYTYKYGICGRGGVIFKELLENLENGNTLHDFFGEQSVFYNSYKSDFYEVEKLESIWKVFPWLYKKEKKIGFDTHVGCNKKCVYCSYPIITKDCGKKRNLGEIKEFIISAEQKNIDFLQIVDDVFNSNINYAKEVCRVIASVRKNVKLSCYLAPNIDEELAFLMKQAGFEEVVMGIDSLSDLVLNSLKKDFTVKEVLKARNILKECGIKVVYTFIIGSGYETLQTLEETKRNILLHMPDRVTMQYGIRVYPGTEICEILEGNTEDLLNPVFSFSDEISRRQFEEFTKEIKNVISERKML